MGGLHYIPFREDGIEKYVNQFNEACGFDYKSGQTQEYLYPYIALKYRFIKFVYEYKENEPKIESVYARERHAIFWRNGGPYGVEHKANAERNDIGTSGSLVR